MICKNFLYFSSSSNPSFRERLVISFKNVSGSYSNSLSNEGTTRDVTLKFRLRNFQYANDVWFKFVLS